MKIVRKEWPKVRVRVKGGNSYYEIDLRRRHYLGPKWKTFTDRNTALKYAADLGKKVAQNGLASVSTEDPKIRAWTEQFALYGKTLDDAIETALMVFEHERQVKESPFMAELLTLWVDDKVTGLRRLRPKSIKSIRNMAEVFKRDFGMARIKEITHERVEEYLKGKNVSDQTRKNLSNYLGQFFNWCKLRKHAEVNPCENIEIVVEKGMPEFFAVEQSVSIMREAKKDENRRMTAYFALGLFGGIRPDEIERMEWGTNVKLATREIFLQAAITKTKRDRLFKMSDNLWAWLKLCETTKPLVPEANVKNHRVKVCGGLAFDWIADGLRHTFATFHYAKHKSLEELRHIMGNSPSIIERFYKGVIPAGEVEKFWSITPSSVEEKHSKSDSGDKR